MPNTWLYSLEENLSPTKFQKFKCQILGFIRDNFKLCPAEILSLNAKYLALFYDWDVEDIWIYKFKCQILGFIPI